MLRPLRWLLVLGTLTIVLVVALPKKTESKLPIWTTSDHPRLLSSPAEKAAAVAKLTTPGTPSYQVWQAFLSSNFSDRQHNYADSAFIYWITGNTTAGNQAIATAEDWMLGVPYGLPTGGSAFNESWYSYLDLILTYDFAYDLIVAQGKKEAFVNYIAMQGARCDGGNPGYAPGNINLIWAICEYGSAMLIEDENVVLNIVDEPVTKWLNGSAESLKYMINDTNIKISNTAGSPTADYTEGVDYFYRYTVDCGAKCIDWSPTGAGTKEPGIGSTYYVSYTFTPDIVGWKSTSRTAFEYHLNYQWHDGYYQGGVSPYGNLVTEQLPMLVEMLKRDTGVDYTQNPDIKHIADMYIYSELPSNGGAVGVNRRFNTINDSNQWEAGYSDALTYPSPGFFDYKSWTRPFIDWAMSAYANDPEGYAARYAWLWTHAYRNADGTIHYNPVPDWREALWLNDAALAPYVNSTTLPPAPWPTQRYFRGRELVVARTDTWNQMNNQAAYFSFVSGNHNYQNEHDQADSGSFTFFSLNEDWGIDPGYSGDLLTDHNSVGIDGTGFNATGVPYTIPSWGGSSHFSDVALNAGATVAALDRAPAWTQTSTPNVQRDQRFTALVNGTQTSYLVVADDIQKNGSNHSYEWYLHTGLGNTVSINGSKATITGSRTGAILESYSLGPEASTYTAGSINDGNLGAHQRLVDTASATTQARFLHLLIPSNGSNPAPTVTRTAVTNGIQALVTWAGGTTDTILWRYAGSTITSTDNIVSDARLTIVRRLGTEITGLIVNQGRSVTDNGRALLTAIDGVQPISVSALGAIATISASDTSILRLGLPFLTSATLEDGGVTVPIYNDGAVVYINGGLALNQVRRNNGQLYHLDFNNGLVGDFFRFNIQKQAAELFSPKNGALELTETTRDWPSFSRRDSTPRRLSGLWPTMIPQHDVGDASYHFRYRFTDMSTGTRDFRLYFRTHDRNPIDWYTNQDYIRLDLNAMQGGVAQNHLTLSQRVNGAWSGIDDNEVVTASLPVATATIADTAWHDLTVTLEGANATVVLDGTTVLTGTLPATLGTGYVQTRVIGTSTVLLDSVEYDVVDHVAPIAPTDGVLNVQPDGQGQYNLTFGYGSSTDMATVKLYESANPIESTTNLAGLTVVATSANTSGNVTGVDRSKYHAFGVSDASENSSQLLPLTIDVTPPATTINLQTH